MQEVLFTTFDLVRQFLSRVFLIEFLVLEFKWLYDSG